MKIWKICVAVGILLFAFAGGWWFGANGKLLPDLSAFGELRDSERKHLRDIERLGRERAVSDRIAREHEKQIAERERQLRESEARNAERDARIREYEILIERERRDHQRTREALERATAGSAAADTELGSTQADFREGQDSLDLAIGAGEEMGELILRLKEQLRGLQESTEKSDD